MCSPLIAKETVQAAEAEELVGKLFDGSPNLLFASLLGSGKLSDEQIGKLRQMIDELK